MTDAPPVIERIQKRSDFLAAARAPSCAKGAVVMQARNRADDTAKIRVGFTATRKIGGAIVRNRAKRRLRAAAQALLPQLGKPGFDYVLIARNGAPARAWPRLLDDVKTALISLAAESDSPSRAASQRAPSPSA